MLSYYWNKWYSYIEIVPIPYNKSFSGLTLILTILIFWVFLIVLTTGFIWQKSQVPRPITFFGTNQSLFTHAAFCQFSESTNGLTLTSDQVKKSEMDVSKCLKEKKRFTAEDARRILLDISDSASPGDYT